MLFAYYVIVGIQLCDVEHEARVAGWQRVTRVHLRQLLLVVNLLHNLSYNLSTTAGRSDDDGASFV